MKYSLWVKIFLRYGASRGVGPPSVNLKKKLKLKMSLDIVTYSPRVRKISDGGVQGDTGPPNVNLGPPKITETTRSRMLKLKTQLYIVK